MSHFLRLRQLSVHGFKSLDNCQADFQPSITVLIGPNGAGKSTILQLFSFIQAFMSGNALRFFEDRAWIPKSIDNFFNQSNRIEAELTFETDDCTQIMWSFRWGITENTNQGESLKYRHNNNTSVSVFTTQQRAIQIGDDIIEGLRLPGSFLSVLDTNIILNEESRAIAEAVQEWGQGIFSLELMNPAMMRRGTSGASWHIGYQGEKLSGFLASLSPAQQDRIVKRLSQFYPSLKALHTSQKNTGWVDLQMTEHFPNSGTIPAEHMSDGYLRLFALASIPEWNRKMSLILIDEVENGIEPHILPALIEDIRQAPVAQLIMTSHSPVLVNRFEPNEVRFVARIPTGGTILAGFNEIQAIQQDIEYQGIGEIWFHTSGNTIEQWVREVVSRRSQGKQQS